MIFIIKIITKIEKIKLSIATTKLKMPNGVKIGTNTKEQLT